jgi:tRNA (guanosine-2'-O-)-methyltransferase
MVSVKRLAKFKQVVSKRRSDVVVVLEDIYDPHNAAAIFRTMDAFGLQKAYLVFDTVTSFNPKKVGKASSSSANKWLDFKVYNSSETGKISAISRCLTELKQEGYKVVASVVNSEAIDLVKFKWPGKLALLVGNEHAGLSAEAISLADYGVYINMQGMVESLNVSVATAVFLWQIINCKSQKLLGKNERQKLLKNFLER